MVSVGYLPLDTFNIMLVGTAVLIIFTLLYPFREHNMQLLFLIASAAACGFLATVLIIGMVGSYESGSLVYVSNTPLFIIIAAVGVFMIALVSKGLFEYVFKGKHGRMMG